MTILICTPARDLVHLDTAMCLASLARATPREIPLAFFGPKGASIAHLRNFAVQVALDQGAEAILWIDSDMVFPPDALARLLRHEREMVGATYRRRGPPYTALGKITGVAGPDGLAAADHLPGGLILVRRHVYEAVAAPWYQDRYEPAATEDVTFCEAARATGFDIWCDVALTAEVQHVGSIAVPWQQAA